MGNLYQQNYHKNQKCIDDSSSSENSHQLFRIDDEGDELRIETQPPPLEEDDFMNKIISENNKNTYRWELGKTTNPVFAELVVEEADGELNEVNIARVALGREQEQ